LSSLDGTLSVKADRDRRSVIGRVVDIEQFEAQSCSCGGDSIAAIGAFD
jgi:hypothetical protein